MRNETIDTLTDYAASHSDVMLLSADLGFSVLERFRDRLPDQFINVGVSEQAMIGIAAGLALAGRRVVVYSIANFPTLRCLEQIRNDVCYHKLNVTVIAVGGGLAYGTQGYTHHGVEDLGIMAMMPNMTVTCAADPIEAMALITHLLELRSPSYLRLGRSGEPILHENTRPFKIDGPIKMREGDDIAMLATGPVLGRAIEAATILASENINVSIYSFPIINPLNNNVLDEIAKSHRGIITLEEHSLRGGFGSMVATWLIRNGHTVKFDSWGITDAIRMKIGHQKTLLDELPSLVNMARNLL